MEQDWEEMQPFWVQSTTNYHHVDRYRRRVSSFLFNSAIVVILVLVTAVCFKLFIVPSVVTVSSQILRPNSVKKSWDSINVVLVLFALMFGFMSRNRNEESSSSDEYRPNPVSPTISDQRVYTYNDDDNYRGGNGRRMGGLRSSSSYPDLRESPPWRPSQSRWRSFDDTEISRVPVNNRRRRSWGDIEGENLVTKNVVHVDVDTEVTYQQQHLESIPDTPPVASTPPDTLSGHHHLEDIPDTPPPPPSPPPEIAAKSVRNKTKREFQSIPQTRTEPAADLQPSTPPPPPPPPP